MIDDAIVVVENVALHRAAGQGRVEAVHSALSEITTPLVGSTITPIVVFLPLIAITGVTGVFFRALAITVGVSLLTSLGLALTLTPTLSQFFIRQKNIDGVPRQDLSEKEKLARRRRSRAERPLPAGDRVLRTLAALRVGSPEVDCGLLRGAGGCVLLLLQSAWVGLAAGRWTRAASCSTTSLPRAHRWRRPIA